MERLTVHQRPSKYGKTSDAAAVDGNTTILIPPESYLAAVRKTLGIIDLDPCSSPRAQQMIDALTWYRAEDATAALAESWRGRVFLHPHWHPTIARYQVQKLLRDYLADRVSAAVLLAGKIDWLRSEPLLLSFPFAIHYRRLHHWRWCNKRQQLERINPSFNHFSLYLPARDGRHFDDERLATFVEAFSGFGRVVLSEDFGDDWQQQALIATRRMALQPVLTESRLQRYHDPLEDEPGAALEDAS